jgi:hypothetical protein
MRTMRLRAVVCVALAVASVMPLAAVAGRSQRLAERRGITVREAREILRNRDTRSWYAEPADPNEQGGQIYGDFGGGQIIRPGVTP